MSKDDYKKIRQFIDLKDFIGAKKFLLTLVDKYQNDVEYWHYSAYVARKTDDLAGAEEYASKALALAPHNRDAVFELGMIYQTAGDCKRAIEFIERAASSEGGEVNLEKQIDILNSLGLTYKMSGDSKRALQRYNVALELLAQFIYEKVKKQPLQGIDFTSAKSSSEGWTRLALQVAIKNSAKDGIKEIRTPSGETAVKLLQQNPLMGVSFYDKDGARYLLPSYFSSFFDALKHNFFYSTIIYNIGVLYAKGGDTEEARKCFTESIEFIPEGIDYPLPLLALKELER